ncbi:hypothetical protein EYR40_001501 [Pleurotus pulmonarius]|nr:hypothetical protein EYR38_004744 [Pleurotus pulmonarius]KAF4609148.1 hypothetical protein EYR40_001501 [Pleurotus pulmonarius]
MGLHKCLLSLINGNRKALPTSNARLPQGHGKNDVLRRYAVPATLLILLCTSVFLLIKVMRLKVYSPMDDYQMLSDAVAVVSTLYTNSYAMATAVLAHSIRTAKSSARLILLYIDGQVSEEALCISRAAGWELLAFPRIGPPHGGKGVRTQFIDQYTKLHIWSLDTIGIKRLVYLDADTLVRRNFDELFRLPFNFAAVPDVYGPGDARGFSLTFNAGVLAIHPSSRILANMRKKAETARYPIQQAEQAFLNLYFGTKAARLPYMYNALIAIKKRNPAVWEELKEELVIVHYTDHKPFLLDSQPSAKILTPEEMRLAMDEAKSRYELWSEEFGWWCTAYQKMMSDNAVKIEQCGDPRGRAT